MLDRRDLNKEVRENQIEKLLDTDFGNFTTIHGSDAARPPEEEMRQEVNDLLGRFYKQTGKDLPK